MPDPNEFLGKVKTLCPKTCILDSKFVRQTQSEITLDLQIKTPMEKLTSFFESHTHMCGGKWYVFSSSISYTIIYGIQKVSSSMLNYVPEDNQTTITGLK